MKKFLILSLIFLVGSCKLNELINNEKPIIIDSLVIHHDTIPYYKENENNYDMMENPDTANGNIKFIFQIGSNDHNINTEYLNA